MVKRVVQTDLNDAFETVFDDGWSKNPALRDEDLLGGLARALFTRRPWAWDDGVPWSNVIGVEWPVA